MSSKLIEHLRAYLEIDKHSLDDELVRQPSLFFDVSDAFAEAVAERDACKEELATVDADLDGIVRLRLEKTGRVTEAAVKHGIQTDTKHADAFDTYILAKVRADKLQALKESFHQRNYMLRELANLYVANYFEQSSVQGNSKTDKMTYDRRRELLAEARARNNDD